MTERLVTIRIAVEPVRNGWRAFVYQDGKAVRMSPLSDDRDVAVLYARTMHDLASKMAQANGQ
jgi:hypothetical protein